MKACIECRFLYQQFSELSFYGFNTLQLQLFKHFDTFYVLVFNNCTW